MISKLTPSSRQLIQITSGQVKKHGLLPKIFPTHAKNTEQQEGSTYSHVGDPELRVIAYATVWE